MMDVAREIQRCELPAIPLRTVRVITNVITLSGLIARVIRASTVHHDIFIYGRKSQVCSPSGGEPDAP
jgi:hypothetical protein